jgi:hypothetical protein
VIDKKNNYLPSATMGIESQMKMKRTAFVLISFVELSLLSLSTALAEESQEELANKLNNPVANLISVPLQNNWDFGIGPADAMRYYVNIQPVMDVNEQGAE